MVTRPHIDAVLRYRSAFGTAFSPFILAAHSEDPEAEKELRGRVLTYLTAGLVLLALVLGLFAREIVDIVAPGFDRAYQATGLVLLGLQLLVCRRSP